MVRAEPWGWPMSARRVVTLHVGTPKSGTTFLQRELGRRRAKLREHGFLYPGDRAGHFLEALSLRERGFHGHEYEAAEGAWERLVEEIHAFDGPVLISHEILGGSQMESIERAAASFPDHTVRAIITCRDLGRQLPAVWQEGVKNGSTERYEDFLASNFAVWSGPESRKGIWSGQNLAGMGRRWGGVLGNENVCFVTVPPPGGDTDALWDRFSEAVALPDVQLPPSSRVGNPSLGTVETELLRRLGGHLPEGLAWPQQSRMVKKRFAQKVLVAHHTGGSLTVPDRWQGATRDVAQAMIDEIRVGGFPAVGDLSDLEPSFRPGGTLPDEIETEQLLDLALELLVPMVLNGDARPPGSRRKSGGRQSEEAAKRPAVLGRARARLARLKR